MPSPSRRRVGAAIFACTAALTGVFTGIGYAAFSTTATSPGLAASTKRIFPGSRTVFASDLRDASSGTGETNASDPVAYANDGRTLATSGWATSFSAGRYLDFDYANPLPGGLAVSNAAFNFQFASANNNTTCFYFEVRSVTSNLVLSTHGSPASPAGCTGTTFLAVTTPLPAVASTDVANELRVRVYENNSSALPSTTDLATITGNSPYAGFTLYRSTLTDASSGAPTVSRWPLSSAADGSTYVNANNWKGGADATRYFKSTFPSSVPVDATVTGASLSHTYKDQDGISVCFYFEVYSGATLIGTHGSALSGYCNNTAAFVTTTVSLPEINTGSLANAVTVKMYIWDGSASKRSQHDQLSLSLSYYLN